jgi:hypothetical protein
MIEAGSARRRAEGEFLTALRGAGAAMQLLGAAAAERIGIMTAGGLSSGST